MMLEAAETLERVDVAAARDVMLEALHTSLLTDPLGGSVTALDLARAIQSGPRPDAGGSELTELVLDGFATRLIGDVAGAMPKLQAVVDALRSGQEPDARQLWPWFGLRRGARGVGRARQRPSSSNGWRDVSAPRVRCTRCG